MTRIIIRKGAVFYIFLTLMGGLIYGQETLNSMLLLPLLCTVLYGMIFLSPPALVYYLIRWTVKREIANQIDSD